MPEKKNIELQDTKLTCQNCETEFEGKYCPNCGQSAKNLNRPFHFVIYDFAGTVFSFDTRFFRSLGHLLVSPGKISRDFVEGRRARYMPPFQMYVFVSFVFFFTLSLFTRTSLKPAYEKQFQLEQKGLDSLTRSQVFEEDTSTNISIKTWDDFNSEKLYQAKLKIDERLRTDTTNSKKEVKVLRRLSRLLSDPNLFFVTMFKYVSWGLFLLMPIFALLLMLFFGRKGYYYTSHLTMSLNLHTFLFILLILGLLVRIIFHSLPDLVALLLFIVFSVYEYIGLKRMYEKRHVRTFFFAGFMNFIYVMVFLIASMAIVTVAFLNF